MFYEIILNSLNICSDALPKAYIPYPPTLFITNPNKGDKLPHICGKKKIFSFDISMEYATTTANFYAEILKHFGTGDSKIFFTKIFKKTSKDINHSDDIVISQANLNLHGFTLDIFNKFMDPNFEVINPGILTISIYKTIEFLMKPTETLIKEAIQGFRNFLRIPGDYDLANVIFQVAIQTSNSSRESSKEFVYSDRFQIALNEISGNIHGLIS